VSSFKAKSLTQNSKQMINMAPEGDKTEGI
jgi:hypothetical protein